MQTPIYLDYAATTPMDPRIVAKMQHYMTADGCFGNPASNTHIYGIAAKNAVELARQQVANLVNADPREIIWTSGATEANNLAIIGIARFYQQRGKHIITVKTEHKAVLDACNYLQKNGYEVTFLTPEKTGILDLNKFSQAIRPDTIFATVMQVNNEIGVIQDIQRIGEICRERHIFFHVDAAQSAGKIPIDLQQLPVDLMSLSAHKVYGPKGIGALYVRRRPKVRLEALIYGGGQEQGLRSGTLATHQIVGMGEAFAIAQAELQSDYDRIAILRKKLWEGIKVLPEIYLNSDSEHSIPHIINFSVAGVDGIALVCALKDIAVSMGSACNSTTLELSHVLQVLGIDNKLSHSTLRLSLGRFTTSEEICYATQHLQTRIHWLRSVSPIWQGG